MFKNGQIVSIINNSEIENNTTLMNLQDEELILRINNDNFLLEHLNGQLVKDEYGKEVIVSPQLLKKVENPNAKELKVGDKVIFLDIISPFKRYGETIASTYMASFKGKQCTVSYINEDNTFKIEEDNKGYLFSRGMTKDYTMIDEKLHFDLDYFKEQDVAIRCETAKECEELFKILRNYNITWCDGDCLIWDNDWEFIYEDGDCFSLTPNGRLEFCNANWYWKDGFRVVSFRNVVF